MTKNKTIHVKGFEISISTIQNNDYISLTDMAKAKDENGRSNIIIQNWMRNRNTIEYLGIWEQINKPNFKSIEFDAFKKVAGLNSFVLTPKQWAETV